MNNLENKQKITAAELEALQKVDIRTVEPTTLVDIRTVKISPYLTKEEKMQEYIAQIKNPYCYLCNGIVVKVSFAGKRSLEECLQDAMFGEK